MTKKQTHPDLKKIISLGRKGIIYPDHIERWIQFKNEWAEVDLTIWDKKEMKVDESGTLTLSPPLEHAQSIEFHTENRPENIIS